MNSKDKLDKMLEDLPIDAEKITSLHKGISTGVLKQILEKLKLESLESTSPHIALDATKLETSCVAYVARSVSIDIFFMYLQLISIMTGGSRKAIESTIFEVTEILCDPENINRLCEVSAKAEELRKEMGL
tara:strand:+ start:318 stop:710 length:393 start_codon:yes stop_codon:yes gene_type:complete